MHGGHHVAQKSITRTWPRSASLEMNAPADGVLESEFKSLADVRIGGGFAGIDQRQKPLLIELLDPSVRRQGKRRVGELGKDPKIELTPFTFRLDLLVRQQSVQFGEKRISGFRTSSEIINRFPGVERRPPDSRWRCAPWRRTRRRRLDHLDCAVARSGRGMHCDAIRFATGDDIDEANPLAASRFGSHGNAWPRRIL